MLRNRFRPKAPRYLTTTGASSLKAHLPPCARCISLRAAAGAPPGTAPPDAKCSGRMARAVSEASLYRQLAFFRRLLGAHFPSLLSPCIPAASLYLPLYIPPHPLRAGSSRAGSTRAARARHMGSTQAAYGQQAALLHMHHVLCFLCLSRRS